MGPVERLLIRQTIIYSLLGVIGIVFMLFGAAERDTKIFDHLCETEGMYCSVR